MSLKIDISDVAIEENESVHQLHMWGIQTSLWKTNCIVCGKDTDATRIRCDCGEGFYCSPARNHRRALVFHSEPPNLSLVWAEVKDSTLIIDDPGLANNFRSPGKSANPWLDLAIVNPAVKDATLFHKLGHGLVIAFASNLLDPNARADSTWRNKGVMDLTRPGHRLQWVGPIVFFCYGYDMSDYVKVDPAQSDNIERGTEAGMTKLDIWNELQNLRYSEDAHRVSLDNKDVDDGTGDTGQMVWKWRVKERGTSMKILDLVHRDINTIMDYLSCTNLNPIPSHFRGSTVRMPAMHVQDPNYTGYSLRALWNQIDPVAQLFSGEAKLTSRAGSGQQQQGRHELVFSKVELPHYPLPLYPMLGAFAVGLRWTVHYSMDINPPFRGNIPLTKHDALTSLLWALNFKKGTYPAKLELYRPSFSCDSILVAHADMLPVNKHHLKALLKYLDFTEPLEWCRHGPKGFEAYWTMYAKITLKKPDAPGPYAVEARIEETMPRSLANDSGED
ncbi:hypothetical protein C8A00DRAFT_18629 [Chaetomidium leptoderma]|uniref:Uncharacterized protein n=1 Tax=Chaetomidium leptoderma TaxID=669021 RepID=A0AAN6VE74_9PEZI|nr:hypothetical protein C8A00DRAFT_18629 [Chaetomidium leptoderma]